MKIAAASLVLCVALALLLNRIEVPVPLTDAQIRAQTAASSPLATVSTIAEKEGRFICADANSYYLFKKDGIFKSFPLGMSGQTIDGTWKGDGPLLLLYLLQPYPVISRLTTRAFVLCVRCAPVKVPRLYSNVQIDADF